MPTLQSYEDLQTYLRTFVNFRGDPVPYDFNGTVHLLLALLDNLREYALEAELETIHELFSHQQAVFFLKLADYIRRTDSTG